MEKEQIDLEQEDSRHTKQKHICPMCQMCLCMQQNPNMMGMYQQQMQQPMMGKMSNPNGRNEYEDDFDSQIMPEYNSEYSEGEEGYRPEPIRPPVPAPTHPSAPAHGPVHPSAPAHGPVHPSAPAHGPVHPSAPAHNPIHVPIHWHKIWHGHDGYYGHQYYKDINYFYYTKSHYYHQYPYDPYFDYYNNTY